MMWRNIPDDLCLAINKKMLDIDLTTIPSNSNSMDDLDYYNGSRSPNGRIYVSALNRGKTGCFKKTSSTSNIFFYTLIKNKTFTRKKRLHYGLEQKQDRKSSFLNNFRRSLQNIRLDTNP